MFRIPVMTEQFLHLAKHFPRISSSVFLSTSTTHSTKSFTDEFNALILRLQEIRAQTRKPTPPKYQPRYAYIGRVTGDKWRPFEHEEMEIMNEQPIESEKPKQTYCLLVAYCGANYVGSQRLRNYADNTIEEMLLRSLWKNKWITAKEYRYPYNVSFESTSRTDKGVSAMGQCFTLSIPENRVTEVTCINQELPNDIRVFGIQRVYRKFSPRNEPSGRTYSYTLPTIAFCQYNDQTLLKNYRVPAEKLHLVNDLLQQYAGNKNFHNFTTDKKPTDQNAWRVMHELKCSQPFIKDGVEFATIHIRGRSFMMHQIRKMIGLLLAVVREATDVSVFERALSAQTVDIPTAPGLGLVLEQVHFDHYNKFILKTPTLKPLMWHGIDRSLEDFRDKFVHSYIVNREISEELMLSWVEELLCYTYKIVPDDEINTIRSRFGRKENDFENDSDDDVFKMK